MSQENQDVGMKKLAEEGYQFATNFAAKSFI